MTARLFSIMTILLVAGSARADMLTLGLPDSYTPGTPFDISIGLAPSSNLGLYNVELVFRTSSSANGLLTINQPLASGSGYVFSTTANFFASTSIVGNEYRVTFSDFTLDSSGPNILASVNDRISMLTIQPSPSIKGSIQVSIEPSSLFIDDANGLTLLKTDRLPEGSISISTNPVSGPGGFVLGMVAIALFSIRQRLRNEKKLQLN